MGRSVHSITFFFYIGLKKLGFGNKRGVFRQPCKLSEVDVGLHNEKQPLGLDIMALSYFSAGNMVDWNQGNVAWAIAKLHKRFGCAGQVSEGEAVELLCQARPCQEADSKLLK